MPNNIGQKESGTQKIFWSGVVLYLEIHDSNYYQIKKNTFSCFCNILIISFYISCTENI